MKFQISLKPNELRARKTVQRASICHEHKISGAWKTVQEVQWCPQNLGIVWLLLGRILIRENQQNRGFIKWHPPPRSDVLYGISPNFGLIPRCNFSVAFGKAVRPSNEGRRRFGCRWSCVGGGQTASRRKPKTERRRRNPLCAPLFAPIFFLGLHYRVVEKVLLNVYCKFCWLVGNL